MKLDGVKARGSKFEGVVGTIREHRTTNDSLRKVKFEVNDDGRIIMLDTDSRSSPQEPTEVVMAKTGPLGNLRTGKFRDFRDGPLTRLLFRIYGMPNQPFLSIPRNSELSSRSELKSSLQWWSLTMTSVAVGCIPLAINGILSHFKSGQSSIAQRVWTILWLAFGICFGPLLKTEFTDVRLVPSVAAVMYMIPALGGFVVVGQMLMQYGTCIQL